MCLCVGSNFFPAYISSGEINNIHTSNIPPTLSLWEKIKDFIFSNHHGEAINCLFNLCHPPPKISREELDGLFFQLKELAAPGYKDNFIIEENSASEKRNYRITDNNGNDILSIVYGKIRIKGAESSWDQVMCLPRTVM